MTDDDVEATRLSSRKADGADDHTRLSSRKADGADDHTRLSSRKADGPPDATSMSASHGRAQETSPASVVTPPPSSIGAVPLSVHGSFGGATTSYDARQSDRVRSVSIVRRTAAETPDAAVASPELRAAREAKRRQTRLYRGGIGAIVIVAVTGIVAVLLW